MSYFIGELNFAPRGVEDKEWRLEQPYGLKYRNYLIIARENVTTDGASIPKFMWPFLGPPLGDENAFWAIFHDAGYRNYALVFDLRKTILNAEFLFWDYSAGQLHNRAVTGPFDRKWWDKMARDGSMRAAGCSRWKRRMVYWGVRLGGWKSWHKNKT